MTKQRRNGQEPRRLEPMPTAPGHRRLEGDALFAWATLQAQARQLQQQIESFVQMQAQELGFDPKQEGIDGGGYIRPIQTAPSPVQLGEDMIRVPQEADTGD